MVTTATPPDIDTPADTPELSLAPMERGLAAMQALNFRIPGDAVHKAVANLPEKQAAAITWFAGYCRRNNLKNEATAQLLLKPGGKAGYYSWASIYAVLTGRRSEEGINLDPFVSAIETFRRVAEEREEQVQSGFIPTRLFELIEQRCERARLRQKIGFIFGDGQIGKSDCLIEVQRRHNHGQTIYVEMPTAGTLTALLEDLGEQLNVGRMNNVNRARRIMDSFSDRMLLIVDEFHRPLNSTVGKHGLMVASFIRELWNRRRCGIMLCMTNEGRDAILHGNNRKALEQLWRRRIQPLQLPNAPFVDDLDRFALSYGLEPAPDEKIQIKAKVLDPTGREIDQTFSDNPRRLQAVVSAKEGLGVWLTILQDASDLARASKRPITWGAVLKAYTLSQAEAEEVA